MLLASLPELLNRAKALATTLQDLGVTVKPSSRLYAYIRELEAGVPLQYAMPPDHIARKWHRLLVEVGDLDEIVRVLGKSPPVPQWQVKVQQSLDGSFLRTEEGNHSRARDVQFELVVASILRTCGYEPRLEEPDIVAEVAGVRLGIAAKRPRSRAKLRKIVKEAGKQIIKHDLPGLIAIDTSVVANPSDKHITTRDFASTQQYVAREATNLAKHVAAVAAVRFGTTNVFGVIVRMSLPVWEPNNRRMSFINQWPFVSLVGVQDSRRRACEEIVERLRTIETAG